MNAPVAPRSREPPARYFSSRVDSPVCTTAFWFRPTGAPARRTSRCRRSTWPTGTERRYTSSTSSTARSERPRHRLRDRGAPRARQTGGRDPRGAGPLRRPRDGARAQRRRLRRGRRRGPDSDGDPRALGHRTPAHRERRRDGRPARRTAGHDRPAPRDRRDRRGEGEAADIVAETLAGEGRDAEIDAVERQRHVWVVDATADGSALTVYVDPVTRRTSTVSRVDD